MSQPMIILYDVPSNIPQPWAPNVWRIRLILNYKRLPYRTCWVEFPDIEQTLRAINAPPSSVRSDGQPVYTVPAILDSFSHAAASNTSSRTYADSSSSGTHHSQQRKPQPVVLTHASAIAEYLEQTYPARPVIPEGTRALQTLFVHYVTEVFIQPLLPIMVPLSHQRLPPRVRDHFRVGGVTSDGGGGDGNGGGDHTRDGDADEHAMQVVAEPQQQSPQLGLHVREEQWAVVQARFTFLADILERNAGDGDGDGVVAMGHELTYADFALCSVLIWIEKVAPHEGWARVREWDGGRWGRLWGRCREYMDVF